MMGDDQSDQDDDKPTEGRSSKILFTFIEYF